MVGAGSQLGLHPGHVVPHASRSGGGALSFTKSSTATVGSVAAKFAERTGAANQHCHAIGVATGTALVGR